MTNYVAINSLMLALDRGSALTNARLAIRHTLGGNC